MLIRIVRMTFQPDKTADFLTIFEASKHKIRQFEGCRYLALLQDAHNPAVYTTYSLWDSAEHLEAYRQSELFQTTWAATKILFADKPVAFSHFQVQELL
ncbi:MAG: antibiotic biosynthesis monooxygenase family protein [Cytophagales bacterium]|nr:antibiotic biosynthesis monooxygenase [Bernardetiaceae bacterium]MDW8203623.1 antibiotic biosynthesis monooxygenase family protein [Cytophagales bacterium]